MQCSAKYGWRTFAKACALTFALAASAGTAFAGAIYATDRTGTVVNANTNYGAPTDVYLSGGPQNTTAAGPADGTYYFQVTDPSGKRLLSTDAAQCRQLSVASGRVTGAAGPCPHANGTFDPANGAIPVQLAPFSATPNAGTVYKAWMIPASAATISPSDPKVLVFAPSSAKTDNFKVPAFAAPPQGSCQPSSLLSVLVSGGNVVAYVPKGAWQLPFTGISVVNVEGTAITPTLVPTAQAVNSCASNPLTGATVCTANGTDVYLLSGTAIASTLTSGGSGLIGFSGGNCTNCGVTMDATHGRALIGLSIAGAPGFQFLNLATSTFEPPFASASGVISEDPLIDPFRNLLLSAAENNGYEIVDVTSSTAPAFFENLVGAAGELDSSGEDCTTGIALSGAEFSFPSQVFVADLTQAVFTAGTPGAWTAASQVQILSESFLSAGASGLAVAQGTHTGIVTGEFGGDELTAIALPATSGSGTPAIADWVSCNIGNGFQNGLDPHTVNAYQSPANGHAVALLANLGATTLAVVDLTNLLDPAIVPRTAAGHACATRPLPASVVSFVSVP
ncbi:MAG: hypothetical protein ACJ78W_15520 [Myxococcales bacterium]